MTTEKTFITKEIVCIGTRDGTKGHIIGLMLAERVEAADIDTAEVGRVDYWPVAILKKYGLTTVGGVYEVQVAVSEDGTGIDSLKGATKFVRRLNNPALVAHWEAKTQATITRDRVKKAEAKLKADTKLDGMLAPLAAVYAKLPWQDRAAFEMFVTTRMAELARKIK